MPRHQRHAVLAGVAALAAGAVYLNALENPFVYDDYRTVIDNTSIARLDVYAIVVHNITRPLINLSYAVDRAVWGADPFGFHLTSVLLHMVNVILLFHLASRLVDDWRTRTGTAARTDPDAAAFAAAALFAVHPMLTEAVGYVSGRSEVLCATFFLAAMLAGRRWIVRGGLQWAAATFLLWLAALATKEIAAMFPIVLFAYDRLIAGGGRDAHRRRALTVHLPLVATAFAAGLARVLLYVRVERARGMAVDWRYVLLEIDVIRRYMVMMLVPRGQAIFHDVPAVDSLADPRALVGLVAVAGLAVMAWLLRGRDGVAAFGLLWFLLLLVPSSALVVLGQGEAMTEHRVALASCGLFLAAGSGVGRLATRLGRDSAGVRLAARTAFVSWLVVLGLLTVGRNRVWSSPVSLWREAAERSPNHFRPRLLLGEALEDAGRKGEAIDEYKVALARQPGEPMAYMKLGLALAGAGRLNEAAATFGELRRIDPQSASASTGLGAVALLAGEPDRARGYFLDAIRKDPRNVSARRSLAIIDEPANPAAALQWCLEVQQLAPETPGNDECIRRNRARLAASGSSRR